MLFNNFGCNFKGMDIQTLVLTAQPGNLQLEMETERASLLSITVQN